MVVEPERQFVNVNQRPVCARTFQQPRIKLWRLNQAVPVRIFFVAAAKTTLDQKVAPPESADSVAFNTSGLGRLFSALNKHVSGEWYEMKAKHPWVVLWKRGSKYGPCWSPNCSHADCNRIRRVANQACPLCEGHLGYQLRLTEFGCTDFAKGKLCHLSCVEIREADDAKKRKRPEAKAAT